MLRDALLARCLRNLGRRHIRRVGSVSSQTTPSDAVSDATVAALASRPIRPLTLADLIRNGRPPLAPSALYNSANFSLQVLPTRLAHRIKQIRSLPFIVVTNSHVAQIHNNYVHSLSTLLPWQEKEIASPEDEAAFTEVLAGLVQTHTNTIPTLARGFLETRRYLNPDAVTQFLDEHLRARIGTRLVAEQHIALHYSSVASESASSDPTTSLRDSEVSSYIGIIDTALRPAAIVSHCESFVSEICELNYGVRPSLLINGDPETCIAHIPVHIEYTLTELLKNAFRATIEQGAERDPIEVTIAPSPPKSSSDDDTKVRVNNNDQGEPAASNEPIALLSQATPGVTIRIRDRGGGISPQNYANLWNYGFTTFNDKEASNAKDSNSNSEALNVISASGGGSTIAGLGYGLPLGRAYAEYFGGGIAVQSLWGWGTDVYLTLRGVGGFE